MNGKYTAYLTARKCHLYFWKRYDIIQGMKNKLGHFITKDISGKKFNLLTAIKFHKRLGTNYYWYFKCDCGKIISTRKKNVISGNTKSCGCYKKQLQYKQKYRFVHGLSNSIFYSKWYGIKYRCYNKNCKVYNLYGGRGIKCLWNNFKEFKEDMYNSYLVHCKNFGEAKTTLDRIDVNGNYCKENCRWATIKEQSRNKQGNHKLTYNGETLCLSEWSEKLSISKNTLRKRVLMGWDNTRIIETKLKERKKK